DYIPKFLAAFMIGTNPEKYGFRRPNAEDHESLVAVPVPSPLSLSKVAEITGVPMETLLQANPHLNKGMTPPGPANYKIWVPEQYQDQFEADTQEKLSAYRLNIKGKTSLASETETKKFHRVRRGESLRHIAQKYKMSLSQIKAINNLKSNRIAAGMKLKIRSPDQSMVTGNVLDEGNSEQDETYRVRRGDNLHDIASRFGVSITHLKKVNKLHRNDLRIGQVLRIAKNS
ncbi:MAG: LysM peptidoglycan-binding domain-containing protein, partial [Proteobacteria bacterium]|nr:LysM peptidoglycan-binding domain-containing protein [Pseudomonadota bacterium]